MSTPDEWRQEGYVEALSEECDRYKLERNVLLLGLCQWMNEEAPRATTPQEALDWAKKEFEGEDVDAEQEPLPRQTGQSQSG